MNPKITIRDAAKFLNLPIKDLHKILLESDLPFSCTHSKGKSPGVSYFTHSTAKHLFKLEKKQKIIAFQIVKGGTGKTSLACAFAIRANLYGLKVLCVDLDQQGNLSHAFDVDAESYPVMIDILAEGYPIKDAIAKVYPGLDVISSRIENALIDDVIKLKKLPLDQVYRSIFSELIKEYDLIVIDCPPNLGQSVAAVTLAVDMVVAPVVPENFALSGLKITCNAINELQESYNQKIPLGIVLNKFDTRTVLSQDALQTLMHHPLYRDNLLQTYIRNSQEFPNSIARGQSIFDTVKPSIAQDDIDSLTREILEIGQLPKRQVKNKASRSAKLEASLA